MNTVKVENLDVLNIGLDRAEQSISTGANSGQPYWRARYQGRGFIITNAQFLRDFDAGQVAVVNLVESEYQIEDPTDATQKITRPSYNFVSYATYQQVQTIETQMGKLKKGRKELEVEMQVLEKKALRELQLDDVAVAKLQDAI